MGIIYPSISKMLKEELDEIESRNNTEKRKFKCIGCGESRPCFVETNQTMDPYFDEIDRLVCILDATNKSFDWIEEK